MRSSLLSSLENLVILTLLGLSLAGCKSSSAPQVPNTSDDNKAKSVPPAPPPQTTQSAAPPPSRSQPTQDIKPALPTPKPASPRQPQVEHGPMNYDPPSTMTVGDTIVVDVAVRRPGNSSYDFLPNKDAAESEYGLRGAGPMQGVEVPVADYMQVNLTAGEYDAFDIVPLDQEVKSLEAGGHSEWHWKVTAKKAGTEELILHSQRIHYGANGQALPIDDGTRPATINVTIEPKKKIIQKGLMELIADNWKKVAVGIITATGTAIWAWWKKWWKKRNKNPGADGRHRK